MKSRWWLRFGLREKLFATHLLVAATSALATLIAVSLVVLWPLIPSASGSIQALSPFALVAVAAVVGVGSAVAAIVVSRWLFRQVAVPVRRATTLAQQLAKGSYSERVPEDDIQFLAAGNDDLTVLAASLNELAESLEDAERRRTESFGEITHELRTPVAILEGYFEGLLDGHVKPSDKTWSMLYDVASRVHRLVDRLQDLSRAEARLEPPDLRSVDPSTIAHAALDRLRLHFEEKGLDLVSDIGEGLPVVLADPDHTIQVLVNLLTNALRYTPSPGKVTLSVRPLAVTVADAAGSMVSTEPASSQGVGEIVFRVTDTGVGIAAEHIPHLFERFFRVDRSGGSGIGLPVSKALVEAMGGRIWAESPGLGKGSTFSFTLLIGPHPPLT